MASTKELKRRMRSVHNIEQITKAMETVAATKMRRAQGRALDGRPFAERSYQLLLSVAVQFPAEAHPLLQKRSTGRQLVVLIATDKGLAGPINSNLFRKVTDFLRTQAEKKRETDFVVVGRKAQDFASKMKLSVIKSYPSFPDDFHVDHMTPLRDQLLGGFSDGTYDKIILAYTNFISTLKQEPYMRGILPLSFEKIEDLEGLPHEAQQLPKNAIEYLYEPDAQTVLDRLLPQLITMLIFHSLLEAIASEHSARMVAMKNASESAEDLTANLQLTFNRARQEGITKELSEIVAGSLSQE